MPSTGFEPVTPAIKRLQTYAFDRMASGIIVAVRLRGSYVKIAKAELSGPNTVLLQYVVGLILFILRDDTASVKKSTRIILFV